MIQLLITYRNAPLTKVRFTNLRKSDVFAPQPGLTKGKDLTKPAAGGAIQLFIDNYLITSLRIMNVNVQC